MTFIRKVAVRAAALSALAAVTAGAQGIGGFLPTSEDNSVTRQGTRGANFLHIPISARAAAMAGAVGSTVTGPTSWFHNAAGAATTEHIGLAIGREMLYGDMDITMNYLGVSFPLFGGGVGLAVRSLNSGDMERTNENTPFGDVTNGRFFQWSSMAAQVGYARRITDRLDLGGTLEFINEGLPTAKISWFAFDVGTQFRTGLFGLVVGGSLQNLGGGSTMDGQLLERGANTNDVSRQTTRYKLFTRPMDLPTAFKFSIGDELFGTAESLLGRGSGNHTLMAEFGVDDAVDAAAQAALGAEYGFKNILFARGGYRFYNDDRKAPGESSLFGASAGFGIRYPIAGRPIRFDYSISAQGDLQNTQIISIELGGR
jgi:hypothetical protein